mmetsp:Transcript_108223/g.170610  ORF Transcript_108223/g.170610 Transcript_108223/m.170610 type:complete len:191 (+) Transcript_108223:100-672(+)
MDDGPDNEPIEPLPADCKTVMIKNVPYKVGEEQLLEVFKEKGFFQWDYFYVPQRHGKQDKRHSMGYAFIGFDSEETTRNFAREVSGYKFPQLTGNKVLAVVAAKYDGADPRNQGKKRRRREKGPKKADGEGGEDESDEESEEPRPPRKKPQNRVNLHAPLTAGELARLDSRGNTVPSWLVQEFANHQQRR